MHDDWPEYVADFVEGAHELAATIPGAELVVMEDAGHVPLLGPPQRGSGGATELVAGNDNRPPDPLELC